jgi:hypothetical protein
MANIYESREEEVHSLLTRASAATGATVVIPDLQRPYVWQPDQVILLVDSLVRGWPFGTLLMWKVDHKELQGIPHREFWQVVDRRSAGAGATMIRKDPPAQYHMVLDGQQRVQSLLLALGGDGWGFRLEDRDWQEQLTGISPRGRRPKYPHWTMGTLCFDVGAFDEEYTRSNDVIGIDYRRVLRWAITDPAHGQSTWSKPENYREALSNAHTKDNKGRFIRLARLWSEVPTNPNVKEKQFREIAATLLKDNEVEPGLADHVLSPMGELMSTVRDVKLSKITYLELRPFDKSLWTEDEYNDAIVNIFTRLNTAGRTLTREEITFAWLKVGWNDKATGGKTAGDAFESLLETVRGKGLPIEMDDLVRGVSVLWAVTHRGGTLLSDKDLLKGDTVRPMAQDLAADWQDIVESIGVFLDTASERKLRYGQSSQYYSLNAVNVIWSWIFLARRWLRMNPQKALDSDAYEKRVGTLLETWIDRWLICSQWAGRWASSSKVLPEYAKQLSQACIQLAATTSMAAALAIIEDRISSLVADTVSDALAYAKTFSVSQREHVSRYNTILWIWHRLDANRWRISSIPLRTKRRQEVELEVDHAVPSAWWQKELIAQPSGSEDGDDLAQHVNKLGNCTLLEKAFNISKSDRSFGAFLSEVHEVKSGTVSLADWSKALYLSDHLLNPDSYSLDEIRAAIDARDASVRDEIVEFIGGTRVRCDLT